MIPKMRYVRALLELAPPEVRQQAARPQFTFSEDERDTVAVTVPEVTRPVEIPFASGTAELVPEAQRRIDSELTPFLEGHGGAYFEVSGNMDTSELGPNARRLSRDRAQAVVDYLVQQWAFERERFVVKGEGADEPLCIEGAERATLSPEDCRARNRATRVGILARPVRRTH
jgi:NitT/TauT family transport system substrate-binding protein